MPLFIIAVVGAESAIALAILVRLYRGTDTINLFLANNLKEAELVYCRVFL